MVNRRQLFALPLVFYSALAKGSEMTYSYYSPGTGTVSVTTDKPGLGALTLSGEPRSMVVASDMARRVYGIIDGVPTWTWDNPNYYVRGLCEFEGLIFVPSSSGTSILALNPRTGWVHRSINVPGAPGAIRGISITRYDGDVWVVLCFAGSGTGTVRVYKMTDLTLTHFLTNPLAANEPRHAELMDGWVFICDTFGHKVYAITLTGILRVSLDVFFPNHIHMLASEWGLITAEHENRVIRWQYHPSVTFDIAYGAPVAPFNDPTKRKADIIALEGGTLDPASTYSPKKSLVAVEAQGPNTLYSPNSARLYGDDLLVADTDNHRVIVVRNGVVVTEIAGFNNPVTAVLI